MNIENYSRAFDTFLMKMESISEPFSEEYQSALEEICDLLHIGKIELLFFENEKNESFEKGEFLVFYQNGSPASKCMYQSRHVSNRNTVLVFRFYLKNGTQSWSEEEIEKAKVFATMLYTFNGKVRLTKYVENATFYDKELGIPNMAFFNRKLGTLKTSGEILSYDVAFFNLKRFSAINQAIGRRLGTKVMLEFVKGLQEKLGDYGIICRAGGDNFVAIFKKEFLDILKEHLAGKEIMYDDNGGYSVFVRANVGIVLIEKIEDVDEELIEKAHMAAQKARNSVDCTCVFFDESIQNVTANVNVIESVFHEAIEKEEFQVYYQPKVQLNTYKLAGAEALCRWLRDGKLIPPNSFIPVLEQGNEICVLDFYMLEHVCRDIRKWLDQGLKVVRVSVNFSRRHLGDHRLLEKIIGIIDKYNVPHSYIEIELTETTTDVGFNDLQQIVTGLHENGIRTSMDDFGVGYSSLNLIRMVPWDVIKIDKSFLPQEMDANSTQYILFRHLLSMFRDLGLKCIVEGVETIEHVKILKENNCFMAQGYFFDKPLPILEFQSRLDK